MPHRFPTLCFRFLLHIEKHSINKRLVIFSMDFFHSNDRLTFFLVCNVAAFPEFYLPISVILLVQKLQIKKCFNLYFNLITIFSPCFPRTKMNNLLLYSLNLNDSTHFDENQNPVLLSMYNFLSSDMQIHWYIVSKKSSA